MTRFLHFSCVSHVSHTHLTRNTLDHTRSRAPRLRACGPLSCAPVRLGSACRRPPTTLTMPQGCPVGESCSRYTRVGGGVAIYISMRARMWGGQIGKFLRACGAHYPLSELLHFYAFSTASAQCALLRFYTENATKLLRNLHPMGARHTPTRPGSPDPRPPAPPGRPTVPYRPTAPLPCSVRQSNCRALVAHIKLKDLIKTDNCRTV
jgi:hypothetical protein